MKPSVFPIPVVICLAASFIPAAVLVFRFRGYGDDYVLRPALIDEALSTADRTVYFAEYDGVVVMKDLGWAFESAFVPFRNPLGE